MPGCWVVADCCWDPDPIRAVGNAHRGDQGRGNSLAHLATAVLGFSPREEPNLLAASRLPTDAARNYPRPPSRRTWHEAKRTQNQDSSKCPGEVTTSSHLSHSPASSPELRSPLATAPQPRSLTELFLNCDSFMNFLLRKYYYTRRRSALFARRPGRQPLPPLPHRHRIQHR